MATTSAHRLSQNDVENARMHAYLAKEQAEILLSMLTHLEDFTADTVMAQAEGLMERVAHAHLAASLATLAKKLA